MARLVWGTSGQAGVSSVEDLDRLLDRLTRDAKNTEPFIVELVADDGSTLSIGLGRELSVVNYVSASLDPPYLQSVGDGDNQEDLVFYYRSDWSEFALDSAVPAARAKAALRRFFETAELPDNIDWKET